MTATAISREEAREQARERLLDVLTDVIPGFRPARPFRCLNPGHEDRHPSMRYLSLSYTVKCFSCGWHGDVFDVVGVVHGLTGGDVFAKTYALLGIDAQGGHVRRTTPPTPKHSPGTIADLLSVIFPPGWDDPEPEVQLPEALAVVAKAETGLMGILAKHTGDVSICREYGLQRAHFDDAELGELYGDLCRGSGLGDASPDFLRWLEHEAAPRHMLRRLVQHVIESGRRRMLDSVFAHSLSHDQNGEPPGDVLTRLFCEARAITGEIYEVPDLDNEGMKKLALDVFEQYHGDETPVAILRGFRRQGGGVDSDVSLLSAALLLALDPDTLQERAGILEYDAGLTRDEANRQALFLAMAARNGRFTRGLAEGFFELAGPAVELEQSCGWPRAKTIDWLCDQLQTGTGGTKRTEPF